MSGGFRNQILPRLVIGGTGNGTGFFEYNGTPKNGNPPIAYAVPPGVTKDPFGNTLGLSGGFVAVSGTLAAQLAAGLLKFSSTVSLPFTTPEVQSLAAAAAGTQINVISGKGTAGATGVTATFYDSLNSPQAVAQVVIGPVLNPVAPSTTALLEVQGAIQTTSLNSIIANGNLQSQLGDCTISAGKLNVKTANLSTDANGFMRMASGLAGDTNSYFVAYTNAGASATPQTISSTVATTITGCSLPVGIGQYAFRARVVFQGASASGTANFSMSAPSNTGPEINALFNMSSGTAGTGVQLAALGPVNSPTLTTGNSIADIEGEVTFTAAGNLVLQCAMSAGGANVIIEKARLWLYPIL